MAITTCYGLIANGYEHQRLFLERVEFSLEKEAVSQLLVGQEKFLELQTATNFMRLQWRQDKKGGALGGSSQLLLGNVLTLIAPRR